MFCVANKINLKKFFPEHYKEIINILQNSDVKLYNKLTKISETVLTDKYGYFGTEVLRSADVWDNYFCDIISEYINSGDTYVTTLFFDTINKKFVISCVGDMIEYYYKKYQII